MHGWERVENMIKKSSYEWLYKVGNDQQLFFILGPCAIEGESFTFKAAEFLKKLSEKLSFKLIFKGSFDKANRISLTSKRGVGIDQGLKILAHVKQEFDLPVITDVHDISQMAAIADVVDVIQIPAFLCRQTDLLLAAGNTGLPIHLKKGQFLAPENMEPLIAKIESTGNQNTWLCERGFTFGYNNLIVDSRNYPIMKSTGKPVVLDATHAVQRPGGLGGASGGNREFVATLAAAAVVQGIAGIFMEVHETPEQAHSDGPNMIRHADLEKLVSYLIDLDAWAKSNPVPEAR